MLTSCGIPLDTTPGRFGELASSDSADSLLWRDSLEENGYLLLRRFLEVESVLNARRSVLEMLAAEGSLAPEAPLDEAKPADDKEFAFRPDLANGNRAVEGLLYGDAILRLFGELLGGEPRHFDYTWLRAVSQGKSTYPHFDIVYMGRGTPRVYTLWCPLGEVPVPHGPLMVLENSHRIDWLRENYGNLDVDAFCDNDPGVRQTDHHGYPFGAFSKDPVEVQERFGGRWLTTDFAAGDVLVFPMFTLHASLDNQWDRIRLSTDSRYQLASDPVDERWAGKHPIAHGADARRGLIC